MCFEIVDQVNFIVVPAYPRARFVFSASFFYCYAAFFFFFSLSLCFPSFFKKFNFIFRYQIWGLLYRY